MQQLVLKVQEDRAPSGIAEFAMVLDRLGTSRRPIYSDANLPDQTMHVTPKVPSSSFPSGFSPLLDHELGQLRDGIIAHSMTEKGQRRS